MKDSCEYKAFRMTMISEGVFLTEMKKVKRLMKEDMQQLNDCLGTTPGEEVYNIVTFQAFIPMSDEAMKETRHMSNRRKVKATAYVVKNAALRMGINFFMTFYRPPHPIQIFPTKEKALEWIQRLRKKK